MAKVRVWCSQCMYEVTKDVDVSAGDPVRKVAQGFADERKSHQHKFLRATNTDSRTFSEIELWKISED